MDWLDEQEPGSEQKLSVQEQPGQINEPESSQVAAQNNAEVKPKRPSLADPMSRTDSYASLYTPEATSVTPPVGPWIGSAQSSNSVPQANNNPYAAHVQQQQAPARPASVPNPQGASSRSQSPWDAAGPNPGRRFRVPAAPASTSSGALSASASFVSLPSTSVAMYGQHTNNALPTSSSSVQMSTQAPAAGPPPFAGFRSTSSGLRASTPLRGNARMSSPLAQHVQVNENATQVEAEDEDGNLKAMDALLQRIHIDQKHDQPLPPLPSGGEQSRKVSGNVQDAAATFEYSADVNGLRAQEQTNLSQSEVVPPDSTVLQDPNQPAQTSHPNYTESHARPPIPSASSFDYASTTAGSAPPFLGAKARAPFLPQRTASTIAIHSVSPVASPDPQVGAERPEEAFAFPPAPYTDVPVENGYNGHEYAAALPDESIDPYAIYGSPYAPPEPDNIYQTQPLVTTSPPSEEPAEFNPYSQNAGFHPGYRQPSVPLEQANARSNASNQQPSYDQMAYNPYTQNVSVPTNPYPVEQPQSETEVNPYGPDPYTSGEYSNAYLPNSQADGERRPPVPFVVFGHCQMLSYFPPVEQPGFVETEQKITLQAVSKDLMPIFSLNGPLLGVSNSVKLKKSVQDNLEAKLREQNLSRDLQLLLKVLLILLKQDGALNTGSTENAVREVLLGSLQTSEDLTTAADLQDHLAKSTRMPQQDIYDADYASLQRLLVMGCRREAIEYATEKKLWAHALIISSGLEQTIWTNIVQQFIEHELSGSNFAGLRAAYHLFGGNIESSMSSLTDSTSDWTETAALILANGLTVGNAGLLPDCQHALQQLAKTLKHQHKHIASHLCYLMTMNPQILNDGGELLADDVEITEAVEYVFGLSNGPKSEPFHGLIYLFPYKVTKATQMVELGDYSQATRYCDGLLTSIAAILKAKPDHPCKTILYQTKSLQERIAALKAGAWNKSGGLMRPTLDTVWTTVESKLSDFIKGGEDAGSSSRSKANDISGPFAQYSSLSSGDQAQHGFSRSVSPMNHFEVPRAASVGVERLQRPQMLTSAPNFQRQTSFAYGTMADSWGHHNDEASPSDQAFVDARLQPITASSHSFSDSRRSSVISGQGSQLQGSTDRSPTVQTSSSHGEQADKGEQTLKSHASIFSGLSGWWGGAKKLDDAAPNGPIKAKLGEKNAFYFDKDLGRWINPAAEKAAPTSVPRSQTASPLHMSDHSGRNSSVMQFSAALPEGSSNPPTRPASAASAAGGPPKVVARAATPSQGGNKGRRAMSSRYVAIT